MDSNRFCDGIGRVVSATRVVGGVLRRAERRTLVRFVPRLFEFGWWDVLKGAVQSAGIEPVDPLQGGQLDLVDGPPRSSPVDQSVL